MINVLRKIASFINPIGTGITELGVKAAKNPTVQKGAKTIAKALFATSIFGLIYYNKDNIAKAGTHICNAAAKQGKNVTAALANNTTLGRMLAFDENYLEANINATKSLASEGIAYFSNRTLAGRMLTKKENLLDNLKNTVVPSADEKVNASVARMQYET